MLNSPAASTISPRLPTDLDSLQELVPLYAREIITNPSGLP